MKREIETKGMKGGLRGGQGGRTLVYQHLGIKSLFSQRIPIKTLTKFDAEW